MYRLADKEQALLSVIELNAELSIEAVAKKTRLRRHTIVYYLSKLKEMGILGPRRASINKYCLGYSDFHFLFNLAAEAKRKDVLTWLTKSPEVAWLTEIGGQHQYALSVRVKSVHQAEKVMEGVSNRFPGVLRDQELSITTAISSFGRRYLYPKYAGKRSFKNNFFSLKEELDDIDCVILEGLSNLDYSSERELSKIIKIPLSTLRRRITRLEKLKIIGGYYHHINAVLLGYETFKLLIATRSSSASLAKQIEGFVEKNPNVVNYLKSLGRWQYQLLVEVKEAREASQMASSLYDLIGSDLDGIQILPVFRYLQSRPFPGGKAI